MTAMIGKILKIVLIGIAVVLGVALVLFMYDEQIMGFYLVFGVVGVGFFLVAMQILSLIQREGQQDD
ncbi:MAG: hypothetical protein GQ523_06035 [Methanophagales archaeon]|nr:hypothetical protein [Methanophagales archaeon]